VSAEYNAVKTTPKYQAVKANPKYQAVKATSLPKTAWPACAYPRLLSFSEAGLLIMACAAVIVVCHGAAGPSEGGTGAAVRYRRVSAGARSPLHSEPPRPGFGSS
jgi:hypothetical protein